MGISTRRGFLAGATAAAGVFTTGLQAQEPDADFEDLVLWYDKPAARWVDALPVGNGRLGAMVFGGGSNGDPSQELLQLNEDTLWSGKPQDGNNKDAKNHLADVRRAVLEQQNYHLADEICQKMQGLFAEAYQPLADLHLDFAHAAEATRYRRELNLDTACARTIYTADGIEFTREVFVSAPAQVLVVRVEANKPNALHCKISLSSQLGKDVRTVGQNRLQLTGKAAAHIAGAGHPGSEQPVRFSDEPGEGMYFAAVLQVDCEGASPSAENGALIISGATSFTLFLSAATGFRGYRNKPDLPVSEVTARAERPLAASLEYRSARAAHVADHQKIFRRVSLRIGRRDKVDPPDRSANQQFQSFARPLIAFLVLPIWPLSIDQQFARGLPARQFARHLELSNHASLEL